MGTISRDSYERVLLIKREMERLIREISGIEGELLSDFSGINIPIDIFEVNNEIFIQAEIPGIEEGDIKVYVSRNKIFLEGAKPEKRSAENANYIWMERPYGSLRRVVELPQACDTRTITAVYKNGILTLRLKRIEERRGEKREVPIKFED
jgi:HSP20 family protein